MSGPTTWKETVRPVSRQLRTAAMVDCHFTYSPKGAEALSKMIDQMADKLDVAHERLEQARKPFLDGWLLGSFTAFGFIVGFGFGLSTP